MVSSLGTKIGVFLLLHILNNNFNTRFQASVFSLNVHTIVFYLNWRSWYSVAIWSSFVIKHASHVVAKSIQYKVFYMTTMFFFFFVFFLFYFFKTTMIPYWWIELVYYWLVIVLPFFMRYFNLSFFCIWWTWSTCVSSICLVLT